MWSLNWAKENESKISVILDLGCGAGRYPKIFKKKNKVLTHATWIGVEIWEPYIEKYNLKDLYDRIINLDIRQFDFSSVPYPNLVILGDVLEHMTKEESIALVNNALDNSDRVLISIPVCHSPQGESEGNPYEHHIKPDWSDTEVKDTFPNILDSWNDGIIGVYLLGKNKEFK